MNMNKIKDLISVILPTYNRSNFLKPCIDKILNSSYQNIELVVVNDASTDNTDDILDSYKNVSNIKVITLDTNSTTVCIPRNIGISHSRGEFLVHADDDVVTLKDKFQILIDTIKQDQNIVLVYGNRKDRFINGTEALRVVRDWNPTVTTGVDNGQILYRSNVYRNIPFSWVYRACDWDLAKNIYKLGNFKHVDELVSIYIWHGGNRSVITDGKLSSTPIPQAHIDCFEKYVNTEYFNDFIQHTTI